MNVALCGERGLANIIKLRVLEKGDYPRLSIWVLNIIQVPLEEVGQKVKGRSRRYDDGSKRLKRCEPRNADGLQKTEEAGQRLFLRAAEGAGPWLTPVELILDF